MNKNIKLGLLLIAQLFLATSCLYSNLDELENSSSKELTNVIYTYRFTYNDTIKKGTPNEEIQYDRICEVVLNKKSESITDKGMKGFKTTLSYDINSVQKAGPSGSVTKTMLFNEFKKMIEKDGITKLWVYVTIPDAASVEPLNGAPKLGTAGDFSKDQTYQVIAADGSSEDYIIKTIQGF